MLVFFQKLKVQKVHLFYRYFSLKWHCVQFILNWNQVWPKTCMSKYCFLKRTPNLCWLCKLKYFCYHEIICLTLLAFLILIGRSIKVLLTCCANLFIFNVRLRDFVHALRIFSNYNKHLPLSTWFRSSYRERVCTLTILTAILKCYI